jgi:epsilon-lactone hydrolase
VADLPVLCWPHDGEHAPSTVTNLATIMIAERIFQPAYGGWRMTFTVDVHHHIHSDFFWAATNKADHAGARPHCSPAGAASRSPRTRHLAHPTESNRRQPMTTQQQADLDATLRRAPLDLHNDVATIRSGFEEAMRHIPVAADIRTTEMAIGGVDAVEVTVDGVDSGNVILYFHGGVYVIGSATASVPLVAELARRTMTKVIAVNYRLAPEDPYPAAVEDARAAYDGLLAQGVDPGNIAVAGESAGGGLTVAMLLASRDADVPMPSSAFVMSPWADLTLSGSTISDRQDVDPLLTEEGLRWGVTNYVVAADPSDSYISPVFGDLRGLPPILIQAGSHEILLSDAIRLAGRAAKADVSVTLDVVPGVPHVFQAYAAVLDEGDAALSRAAAFLKAHFPHL